MNYLDEICLHLMQNQFLRFEVENKFVKFGFTSKIENPQTDIIQWGLDSTLLWFRRRGIAEYCSIVL